jgi:hypothetical protein
VYNAFKCMVHLFCTCGKLLPCLNGVYNALKCMVHLFYTCAWEASSMPQWSVQCF